MTHEHSADVEHNHTHTHGDVTHSHSHAHEGGEETHEHPHTHGHVEKISVASSLSGLAAQSHAKRLAKREEYSHADGSDLDAKYEEAWIARQELTSAIVAITEEMIARLVLEDFPTATEVVLYEDHSHDAPHAHVLYILSNDVVLIEGTSDEWHDQMNSDIDELVWDLHHIDRPGFVNEDAHSSLRLRRIPTSLEH